MEIFEKAVNNRKPLAIFPKTVSQMFGRAVNTTLYHIIFLIPFFNMWKNLFVLWQS